MEESLEQALANFQEPVKYRRRYPYVLFGKMGKVTTPNGAGVYVEKDAPLLHCLDCSNCAGQQSVIDHYVKKGFKILKWWFPMGEDARPYMGQFGPENHFIGLEQHIKLLSGILDDRIADYKRHNDALQAKIAEYEAKAKKGKNDS